MYAYPVLGSQAATLVSEGFLSSLVSDWGELPNYWRSMLRDFPGHPVIESDPTLSSSAGVTLYGFLDQYIE